jgi:hypothetical protein
MSAHTDPKTVGSLALLADCAHPGAETEGARFLERVQDACREVWAEKFAPANADAADANDEAHEVADSSVTVYTAGIWAAFVELEAWHAWDDYRDEMGSSEVENDHGNGMTAQAAVALYWIGHRLALDLFDQYATADEEARAELEDGDE